MLYRDSVFRRCLTSPESTDGRASWLEALTRFRCETAAPTFSCAWSGRSACGACFQVMLVTGANLVGVAVVVRGGTGPLVRLPRYGGQHDRDHRDHSEHVGKADADDELDVVTAHVTSKLYSVARR